MAKKKLAQTPRLNTKLILLVLGIIMIGGVLLSFKQKTTFNSRASCPMGSWTDSAGKAHQEQKVPCSYGQCGADGCAANQTKTKSGGAACCFQTAIGSCVNNAQCQGGTGTGTGTGGGGGGNTGSKPRPTRKPNTNNNTNNQNTQNTSGLAKLKNCIETTCRSQCNPNPQNNTISSSASCMSCLMSCMGFQ